MATCSCGAITTINIWPDKLNRRHGTPVVFSISGEKVFSIYNSGDVVIHKSTIKLSDTDVLKEIMPVLNNKKNTKNE